MARMRVAAPDSHAPQGTCLDSHRKGGQNQVKGLLPMPPGPPDPRVLLDWTECLNPLVPPTPYHVEGAGLFPYSA